MTQSSTTAPNADELTQKWVTVQRPQQQEQKQPAVLPPIATPGVQIYGMAIELQCTSAIANIAIAMLRQLELENGSMRHSYGWLATEYACSADTVKRALTALERNNWISSEGKDSGKSKQFTLLHGSSSKRWAELISVGRQKQQQRMAELTLEDKPHHSSQMAGASNPSQSKFCSTVTRPKNTQKQPIKTKNDPGLGARGSNRDPLRPKGVDRNNLSIDSKQVLEERISTTCFTSYEPELPEQPESGRKEEPVKRPAFELEESGTGPSAASVRLRLPLPALGSKPPSNVQNMNKPEWLKGFPTSGFALIKVPAQSIKALKRVATESEIEQYLQSKSLQPDHVLVFNGWFVEPFPKSDVELVT